MPILFRSAMNRRGMMISSSHRATATEAVKTVSANQATTLSYELYAPFFGLSELPFTLVPDPAFLYWSQQHERAFAVLEFGIMSRAPITLLTGEIGAGKTTLVQELIRRMSTSVTFGLVSNAQGDRGELLQWILNAFAVEFDQTSTYVQLFRLLQDYIVREYAEGRHLVLIFDEAQNLSVESLEELRMLTNFNSNKDELVQLVLVGQPELRDIVKRPDMRQLAQRVAASFHLRKMDAANVRAYIAHRLRKVGGTGNEFDPEACDMIHGATQGVPRLVNQLSGYAMLYAWSLGDKVISGDIVKKVLADGVFFSDMAGEGRAPGT